MHEHFALNQAKIYDIAPIRELNDAEPINQFTVKVRICFLCTVAVSEVLTAVSMNSFLIGTYQ